MYPRVKYPRIFCTPRAKYPKDIRYPVGKKCTPIDDRRRIFYLHKEEYGQEERTLQVFKHLTMEDNSLIYEIYRRLVHYSTIHSRCSIFTPRAGRRCRCSPYRRCFPCVKHYLTATTSKKATRSTATKMEQRLLLATSFDQRATLCGCKKLSPFPMRNKKRQQLNSVNYTRDLPFCPSLPIFYPRTKYPIRYYVWGCKIS